jgi:hypothetical protein
MITHNLGVMWNPSVSTPKTSNFLVILPFLWTVSNSTTFHYGVSNIGKPLRSRSFYCNSLPNLKNRMYDYLILFFLVNISFYFMVFTFTYTCIHYLDHLPHPHSEGFCCSFLEGPLPNTAPESSRKRPQALFPQHSWHLVEHPQVSRG